MSKSSRTLWAQQLSGSLVKGTSSAKTRALPSTSKSASEKKLLNLTRNMCGKQLVGIVLGIDPSLRGTGLSVVEAKADGTIHYIESLTIKNHVDLSMPECLARILKEVQSIIKRHKPICVAIEQSVYVQNFRTAIILGSARGAAIAAAASFKLEVFDYPPLRIKQAVIGYGRASKEQIAKSILNLVKGAPLLPLDEADATGAALTHIFTHKT